MKRLENIHTLYTANPENPFELLRISDAVIVWDSEKIHWVGERSTMPKEFENSEKLDAEHQNVIPALIDCHTHLAFAGNRWNETTVKIQGKSYLEIAESGGGIRSTVAATRKASFDELVTLAQQRLQAIKKSGVRTIECKSGYGLNLESELKILRVYKQLAEQNPDMRMCSTLLAAHTIPTEFQENRSGYINLIIHGIIPAVAEEGLADFFDVFVEKGAFTFDEAVEMGEIAKLYGMKIKLHADQLSHQRGAELSARLDAVSADHLEQIKPEDFHFMRESGTVAVSLPIASAYLNQPVLPARKLLEAKIPVAVATDFNPGSAPVSNLHYAMNLAVVLQRMTADEVMLGVTVHAATALGMSDVGVLATGYKPEFLILESDSIEEWIYGFEGENKVRLIY